MSTSIPRSSSICLSNRPSSLFRNANIRLCATAGSFQHSKQLLCIFISFYVDKFIVLQVIHSCKFAPRCLSSTKSKVRQDLISL